MEENKIRKVFLEELPRKYGFGKTANKLIIDWKSSIGYKIKFIYDDVKGELEILEYISDGQRIKIKYNDKVIDISSGNLQKCKIGKILNKKTIEFKIEIEQTFIDNTRDLIIIDREYRKSKRGQSIKYYRYKCNKCGYDEGWISEYHLLHRKGKCQCCNKKGSKTVVRGINDVATTNPELIKYFVNMDDAYKNTRGSENRVYFKCPDCEFEKEMRISNLFHKGFSCPKCGDGISYPNKFMFNMLEQLDVEFETEYSPEWIGNMRYDFYIRSKQLIIEMDGGFHNIDNNMSGQTKEESKEIDDYKDKLANEHGLEVIRIDCDYKDVSQRYKYITNSILNSKLNNIFKLENIDLENINKLSQNSKIKEVCKYWNIHNEIKNENLSTTDLGNIFKLCNLTIRRYLNIGNQLNWCNYTV